MGCRDVLETSVSQKNVAMKCWRRVLWRIVGEECCKEVLEKDSFDGCACQEKAAVADAFFARCCNKRRHTKKKEPVYLCVSRPYDAFLLCCWRGIACDIAAAAGAAAI